MSGIKYMLYILEKAQSTLIAWKDVKGKLSFPACSVEEFEKILNETEQLVKRAEELREARSETVNARNEILLSLWLMIKSVRDTAKSVFGNDSPEMEKFGGQEIRFKKILKK